MTHRLHPTSGKDVLALCPREYRYKQDNRGPSTDTQNNGTLCHSLTFGGKKAELLPFDSMRTSAAKEWWAAAEKRGVIPMKSGDKMAHIDAAAKEARFAIMSRFGCIPDAPNNDCEVQLDWASPEGAECSGTPDCVLVFSQEVVILDLKTWDTLSTFARTIVSCGYHIQLAGYVQAVALKYPGKRIRVVFLAQSLKPPYCNLFVWLSDDVRDYGRQKWQEACEKYAALTAGDFWEEGYEDQTCELTGWQRSELNAG